MRIPYLLLASAVLASGCMKAGNDYVRPSATPPVAFVEPGPWKEAAPSDAIARSNWWEIFQDPVLNRLEEDAKTASPRLQAAVARVDQARAILGYADAGKMPTLEFAPDASRYRVSGNRPDQPEKVPGNHEYTTSRFRMPLYASYEVDLWGKVSRQLESAGKRMEASVASYHTALLTLQGDVAQTYFQLRAADEEVALLKNSIELRVRARDLVAARKRGGLASELDLARIETELAINEADTLAAEKRRMELQHALAVLVGILPGRLSLEPAGLATLPPVIPSGLPADLLERRPDVAEAERLLAARNAEIGVAKAAWFPAIRLTGGIGFESAELSDVLDQQSQIWSLGVSLVQPIFDGGRLSANEDRARALYAENLAVYRERLLVAFKEVETSLAALRILDQQHESQLRAVNSATRAEQLATSRYKTGLTNVLELIDAQRTRLLVERVRLQVRQQQLLASVTLIRALGGGWEDRKYEAEAAPASRQPGT